MDKKIQIAFVISNKHNINEVASKLTSLTTTVDVFDSVGGLMNTSFYEVIILHEAYLNSFKRELFPNSALIIVADNVNGISDLIPKIENSRVHTIITMPLEVKSLQKHINDSLEAMISNKTAQAVKSEEGKSVFITSFSNGAGKSLLSYNLASKMAQFFPDNSVCLVDMNQPLSIGRAMLNIEDAYSWQTLQPLLQEGTVTNQKIANIVYLTKHRFSLLSGPTNFEKNQALSLKEFKNLDSSLKKIFKVVIYDYHTIQGAETISYVNQCDVPVIVADATSISMLQLLRGMTYLRENDIDLVNKLRFIINRVDEKQGKSADLIAARLEIIPFGTIDEDSEAVSKYMENGQLFEVKSLLLDRQLYTIAEAMVRELF